MNHDSDFVDAKTEAGRISLWRASLQMALVSVASVAPPQAQLRDAASLGLTDAASPSASLPSPQWWRDFGDETLNTLVAQALQANPSLKLAQARLAHAQAASEMAQAIFDAGRLRANLRGKNADLDAAVESYNAAVIQAVREVADQLASSQAIARQQLEQRAAQHAAEGAYAIAVQRYKAGLGNYLNVLTAETSVLAQRRLALDLASRALDTQLALMHALGGGYFHV